MSLRETAAGASSPEAVLLTITSAARRRDIGFGSDLPTPLRFVKVRGGTKCIKWRNTLINLPHRGTQCGEFIFRNRTRGARAVSVR